MAVALGWHVPSPAPSTDPLRLLPWFAEDFEVGGGNGREEAWRRAECSAIDGAFVLVLQRRRRALFTPVFVRRRLAYGRVLDVGVAVDVHGYHLHPVQKRPQGGATVT